MVVGQAEHWRRAYADRDVGRPSWTESVPEALGNDFELVSALLDEHRTPAGRTQQFLHAHVRWFDRRELVGGPPCDANGRLWPHESGSGSSHGIGAVFPGLRPAGRPIA